MIKTTGDKYKPRAKSNRKNGREKLTHALLYNLWPRLPLTYPKMPVVLWRNSKKQSACESSKQAVSEREQSFSDTQVAADLREK